MKGDRRGRGWRRALYRCTHDGCRQRVSLARPREQYTRDPRCPACGLVLTGRRDREPQLRATRDRCGCDGYAFPHRRGSGCWCTHSTRMPSDADYEARGYRRSA